MTDDTVYRSETIEVYEWPQPCCEIFYAETDHGISIRSKEDAEAIIESLKRLVAACET